MKLKKISIFLLFLSLFCLTNCKKQVKTPQIQEEITYKLTPEYEPNESIWLLYPNVNHKKGLENANVTAEIIKNLLPTNKVVLVCASDSMKTVAYKKLGKEMTENTNFKSMILPFQEFWARDMGPLFVKNQKGALAMADFNFNAWDYGDSSDVLIQKDEKLDENIAKKFNLPLISSNMTHEGGDHEMNSQGVLMVVKAVEKQRNPNMSLEMMEVELKRLLGAKKILWLEEGVLEDESTFSGPLRGKNSEMIYTALTTNGHIDEFARFVNDSTILLADVDAADLFFNDPIAIENKKRLDKNYEILHKARNINGKYFKIIRIPLPVSIVGRMEPGDPVYDIIAEMKFVDGPNFPKGKAIKVIAAASYCNFLIANEVVIAPKYFKKGDSIDVQQRDETAKQVLQSVFPNKKIVMIDALSLNLGGGGIHCITNACSGNLNL
jgi:agmatine deiminase